MPKPVLRRISALLALHQDPQTLRPGPGNAEAWLRRPHAGAPFHSRAPLELLTSDDDEEAMEVLRFTATLCAGAGMASIAGWAGEQTIYADADIVIR